MTTLAPKPPVYERLHYREILAVAIETFRSNKVRFALTALGMVIGTASLILVVTIGLTGKQYILREINSIGANMITANYEGGTIYGTAGSNDFMTLDDIKAIRAQVPGIVAASPDDPTARPGAGARRQRARRPDPRRLLRISVRPQPHHAGRALLRRLRHERAQQGRAASPSRWPSASSVRKMRRSARRSSSMVFPSLSSGPSASASRPSGSRRSPMTRS